MLVLERNHDPIFNWHLNFTFGVELLYDLAYYSLQHLLFSQMQVVLKSNFDDLDITARNISIWYAKAHQLWSPLMSNTCMKHIMNTILLLRTFWYLFSSCRVMPMPVCLCPRNIVWHGITTIVYSHIQQRNSTWV